MSNGTIADILVSVEVARIELEYASADLAAQGGHARWRGDADQLEAMLACLRVARVALAAAHDTLGAAAAASLSAGDLVMAS